MSKSNLDRLLKSNPDKYYITTKGTVGIKSSWWADRRNIQAIKDYISKVRKEDE